MTAVADNNTGGSQQQDMSTPQKHANAGKLRPARWPVTGLTDFWRFGRSDTQTTLPYKGAACNGMHATALFFIPASTHKIQPCKTSRSTWRLECDSVYFLLTVKGSFCIPCKQVGLQLRCESFLIPGPSAGFAGIGTPMPNARCLVVACRPLLHSPPLS